MNSLIKQNQHTHTYTHTDMDGWKLPKRRGLTPPDFTVFGGDDDDDEMMCLMTGVASQCIQSD